MSDSTTTTACDVSGSRSPSIVETIDYPIVLNLYVNTDIPELVEKYKTHIEKHNQKVSTDPFPDSGFDLFVPQEFWCTPDKLSVMVNHQVKCEMIEQNDACGFFSFPRSSISKTPLMLANHTGIIDSGYRGFLFGAFRNLSNVSHKTEEGARLLQICHPSLKPFKVRFIENEEHLSTSTRGSGGFGSTGV
jgi:dUTP pyrophosphatase